MALLIGERAAPKVRELLGEGDAAITSVNVAEAVDVLRRRFGVDRGRVRAAIAALTDQPVAVLVVDEPLALRAADLRTEHYHRSDCPVSLADCMLLAAAGPEDRIVTADSHVLAVAAGEGIAAVELPGSG